MSKSIVCYITPFKKETAPHKQKGGLLLPQIQLDDYQLDAVDRMKNGCILCGEPGAGKSLTAIAYFCKLYGADITNIGISKMNNPPNLYIITTAKKRDDLDWYKEISIFHMNPEPDKGIYKGHKVTVDSWNNVHKYTGIKDSFFIFDEQRVVGTGKWSKSFISIARKNQWILLSATPGDTWKDYAPVFIANGFYKNITEFRDKHVLYNTYRGYPSITGYRGEGRLTYLRNSILVDMDYSNNAQEHHEDVWTKYDIQLYKKISKERWDIWEDAPIENASKYCSALRRVVNSDESKQRAVLSLIKVHTKSIIFYNFDYELDILKNLPYGKDYKIAEWNGHKHEPIPNSDKWVYLVQYTAGAEGWNCIQTDTIIFFSQTYSYKTLIQSCGRINRRNTPFHDLFYYHLKSRAGIDLAISRALKKKKKFNERDFYFAK